MNSENVLTKIKENLNNKEITEAKFRKIVQDIFLKHMGYEKNYHIDCSDERKGIYKCDVDEKILICSCKYELRTRALNILTTLIKSKFEWGILFHSEGIWVINDNIEVGNDDFRSNKIVLEIDFDKMRDAKYFKYLSYQSLVEEKNLYYFRDIIIYKNQNYNINKKSWSAYHTAIKRFFDAYISESGRYDLNQYNDIDTNFFLRYIKKNETIRSIKTAKNQFFYVKDFIVSKNPNSTFNETGKEIENKLVKVLSGSSKNLEVMDKKKLYKLLDDRKKGKYVIRNKTLLLMLISFGMTRRQICTLRWDENISDKLDGLYYCKENKRKGKQMFKFPKLLENSIRELRESVPHNAEYVFGNNADDYRTPMQEQTVSGILEGFCRGKENDEFYKLLTTGNIRRWLFHYLLEQGYPLQDIMALMNISISSLSNYTNDMELKKYTTEKIMKSHPMDDFLEM